MKKRVKQYKAVFRTKIDLKQTESYHESLHPGNSYYFEDSRNMKVHYTDIVNESVWIINTDLKPELQKYTDIFIEKVQVQAVYEGSIEIIYTVILSFLDLASGLKDLYETVQLISEISERHINKRLDDRFGRHFNADTYVIVPGNRDYWRGEKEVRRNWNGDNSAEKRDAFFYYLLGVNIVLMIIVGLLVFGAVKMVYFGSEYLYM